MELGMIGIGRMGANMAQRLVRAGHKVVGYARTASTVEQRVKEGAISSGATSLEDVVHQLSTPRILWLMVPAASVDDTIAQLLPHLSENDIIIDGGNSNYQDDIRRAAELKKHNIHYVDCGTSGGVWGLERGYCEMIGGEVETVKYLDPIFKVLAPGIEAASRTPDRTTQGGTAEYGYLHCGPHGAGHFVKMVHNGIEYGIMAAYAEGLNILRHANIGKNQGLIDAETAPVQSPEHYQYDMDLPEIAELWRRGSVISSWLLDLTAHAFQQSRDLSNFSGRVSDSGEGRWTVKAAIDEGVPAHVLSAALYDRFESRNEAEFANKVLSAMRFEFGGHHER
ncbi:phosphogluconate dehydrogenase (NAD(+)-dependent, decarboxylating) [Dictyobacter aurantiacus]|uniref:6-phosphogluconate dehydrogenase n=1 Tax=Dictyobacter aurantiacus TaxID=1936993 RepID=A0A401Z7P2_9CHLR|nr:decarboxylating 6-phosphogluconate dehydrogenase [Dictyobacter aurantiacus]GCE02836.1 6-phosphogluconate dehydrogenase [Dictyobacter aurantiacus]